MLLCRAAMLGGVPSISSRSRAALRLALWLNSQWPCSAAVHTARAFYRTVPWPACLVGCYQDPDQLSFWLFTPRLLGPAP